MPQDIVTTVYTFAELTDDKARAKALQWLADAALDGDWWDSIYCDAENIGAKITGFDVYRRDIDFRLQQSAIDVAVNIAREHGDCTPTYQAAQKLLGEYDTFHGVNGSITLERKALAEGDRFSSSELEGLESEWENVEKDFTRDLGQEYLTMLRDEYEYMSGEEYLADFAEANGYTFTAEGKRFG